jgi:hypothetical protein
VTDPNWQRDLPPRPFDYSASPAPDRSKHDFYVFLKFSIGFGIGVVLSLMVWRFKFGLPVLGLKLCAAAVLMFFPTWRSLAAGLLLSIAVGALIFVATCGGNW